MRTLRSVLTIGLLSVVCFVSGVKAQMATEDEALLVAHNWIGHVIQQEGRWGDAEQAEILTIEPFTRNGRVLGRFFRVEPAGFIVVSLYKELAPIKAYSAESNLDPDSNDGMADLLKMKMEGILDVFPPLRGSLNVASGADLQDLLEIDYRSAWHALVKDPASAATGAGVLEIAASYQGGQSPLLASRWHQQPPYNNLCPSMNCTWPDQGYQNQRAVAGCGAIGIAQIMRYWAWPPFGVGYDDANNVDYRDAYDWTDMLDAYYWSSQQSAFVDGAGERCSPGRTAAVAELCYEAGRALGSGYSCTGTTSKFFTQDRVLVNHFRYADQILWTLRRDNNPTAWFNGIKADLSRNRLISYAIPNHGVVIDGWTEDHIGKRYHINYGWTDENRTMWYNLDEIVGGNTAEEAMLLGIRPTVALPAELAANQTYGCESFNYRYFTEDTTGQNVTFAPGQNLQFLPRVTVECSGSPGYLQFLGQNSNNTRLFSIKGTTSAGIAIKGQGAVVLRSGGGLRFF